jgi:hypothetical protein
MARATLEGALGRALVLGFAAAVLPWLSRIECARAQTATPRSFALNWVRRPGAESCPTAAELARQIDERLGRRVFSSPSTAEFLVEAWVARQEEPARGWLASIAVYAANGVETGRRELTSDDSSCAKLAEASVLAIALMVDPEAAEAERMTAPASKHAEQERTVAPAVWAASAPQISVSKEQGAKLSPTRPAESTPQPAFRAQLSAGAVLLSGLLPGAAAGIVAAVRARPPASSFAVALSGAYYFKNAREYSPGKGARFNTWYLGVAPCWTPAQPFLVEPWLCVGAELGALNATGYGFQEAVSVQRSWLLNGAFEGHALIHLSPRWAASASAGLIVPLRRETFDVAIGAEREELFRASALAARFALGLSFDW